MLVSHVPGDSGPKPAAAPVLLAPDPGYTAAPSLAPLAAAHSLESGSPCYHPWSCPRSPAHLRIKKTFGYQTSGSEKNKSALSNVYKDTPYLKEYLQTV